jgi:hypothetical protein
MKTGSQMMTLDNNSNVIIQTDDTVTIINENINVTIHPEPS